VLCSKGEVDSFPPCISRLLSMHAPNTPTTNQSFYLACFLLNNGYTIEDCKKVFKRIFGEQYDEKTADMQLKLIKITGIQPFECNVVKHLLGICSPECSRYRQDI
jgi:DNA primase large subunit